MAPPVVLQMDVHCHQCARKIKKAVENLRGVKRVWASPEQGLVEVHGTADAWTLRRRIERKLDRPVEIASDGSAPYVYPSQPPAYGAYYPQPPQHAYYPQSQLIPPPPPPGSYPYSAAGGYGSGWADPDPYGYAAHSTVSACSIM